MSNPKQLTTMLKQLGWGTGFRLPISNEENRKLEQLLEAKQSKLVRLSLEMQEVTLAVDNSTTFMKNLNSKLKHAKVLRESQVGHFEHVVDVELAKRSQAEKERHFLGLAERDYAKTEQEVRNREKRLREGRDRNKHLEENVLRRKDVLRELVDVINFDKKAITAYEEKFSKEDAYMKLIEDFADVDNERLKKCRDEYQQLGEKVANSKVRLNQTVSETEIMEGELEELARRFRKVHAERNQSIDVWKRTLEVLEDRDQEIMDTSSEYQKVVMEAKKKIGMLERQENFYENIKLQSRCYDNELNQLERSMSIMHGRNREAQFHNNENSDAVEELLANISVIDKEIKTVQTKLKGMSSENNKWENQLQLLHNELEIAKKRRDAVSTESLSSIEHAKQLEEFLEKEEKKEESLAKELAKQIELNSQRERQYKEIGRQIMLLESDTNNLKATLARTKKKRTETNEFFIKRNAVAYRLDLKVVSLQMKVRGLENPSTLYTREDFTEIQRQIAKLKDVYAEQLLAQSQVKAHISHCEHVGFACQREVLKEDEQNQQFIIKINKLLTEIKRIGKEDETFLEDIKDHGVKNSLMQVQLHRILHSIKNCESKMFDLEQQRITLQMAVNERKTEIDEYTSLLLNKKRALQEESQKLRIKCHDVSHDVKLKKVKYEMVMEQMWKGKDNGDSNSKESLKDGEKRSEAYYIIKLAQEREHYRQEGDKWDERVKEAEKIVEGLQNTMALMIGTNESFKDSLRPATENTDEGRQLKDLKQKEIDTVRSVKLLKDDREKNFQKLRQMQHQLDKLISNKSDYEHQIMEKQYELQGIVIEINGQKEKIQRATQLANKLVRELSKLDALDAELLQNDLRLRVTKEKYEYAVLTLEKLLQINPNLIEDTLEFLHAKGMDGLTSRIARKLISPSLTSTPHQSGRSTPHSCRSIGSASGGRSKSQLSSLRIGSATVGSQHSIRKHQSSFNERQQTRKSVVFDALTSAPAAKKMLDNISKGIEAHRKSKSAETSAPRQTLAIGTTGETTGGGISFGELRKALQDAVAEQQVQQSKMGSDVQHAKHVESLENVVGPVDSTVELVDKREQFDNAVRDDQKRK